MKERVKSTIAIIIIFIIYLIVGYIECCPY